MNRIIVRVRRHIGAVRLRFAVSISITTARALALNLFLHVLPLVMDVKHAGLKIK